MQQQQRRQPGSLGWGLACLTAALAIVGVEGFIFAAKALPPAPGSFYAWAQADWYYCLLVPLTLPVTVAAVTLNWFSLKLFRHNS